MRLPTDILIVTMDWTYLVPFSRYWRMKLEDGLVDLFTPPLFDAPTWGSPLEFLEESDLQN